MHQSAIGYGVVRTVQFSGHGYDGFYVYDEHAPGRISVQSDPIGLAGGINTYAYVGGDPIAHFGSDWIADNRSGQVMPNHWELGCERLVWRFEIWRGVFQLLVKTPMPPSALALGSQIVISNLPANRLP